MTALRYYRGVTTLMYFPDRCNGCGRCVEVCPHGVFVIENRRCVVVDRDACMECGACARNCRDQAITVKAGVGCASAVINSVMGGGGDCSCDCDC